VGAAPYLSYLSPEHQQYWNTFILPGVVKLPDGKIAVSRKGTLRLLEEWVRRNG